MVVVGDVVVVPVALTVVVFILLVPATIDKELLATEL